MRKFFALMKILHYLLALFFCFFPSLTYAATEYFQVLSHTSPKGEWIAFEDGSKWSINWWYQGKAAGWSVGDRIVVNFSHSFIEFQDLEAGETVCGQFAEFIPNPKTSLIQSIQTAGHDRSWTKIYTSNGLEFLIEGTEASAFVQAKGWASHDPLLILNNGKGSYTLWNISRNSRVYSAQLTRGISSSPITKESIRGLSQRLDKRVLAQPAASTHLAAALANFAAGLQDPNSPIGVFLFLGPTGVGKTEMAKSIASELYSTAAHFIRFDMSQFNVQYSVTSLIGSGRGYVNHDEGGMLTEALKANPSAVVLLDEFEKAHSEVRKLFLPVFDEGYICDSAGSKIDCKKAIFVLTSNLCSLEVYELYEKGYSPEEILEKIEPQLIQALSPELYARVTPVVFRPLSQETFHQLVHKMLAEVAVRLLEKQNLCVVFDPSVISYLELYGYQPRLGARPLKGLIKSKVLATISNALLAEDIPPGSTLTLTCLSPTTWITSWTP